MSLGSVVVGDADVKADHAVARPLGLGRAHHAWLIRQRVRLFLKPQMSEWLIREATTARVDRVIKNHVAAGLDHKALQKHLNQLFDVAVRHDALATNPVDAVARIPGEKQVIRPVVEM